MNPTFLRKNMRQFEIRMWTEINHFRGVGIESIHAEFCGPGLEIEKAGARPDHHFTFWTSASFTEKWEAGYKAYFRLLITGIYVQLPVGVMKLLSVKGFFSYSAWLCFQWWCMKIHCIYCGWSSLCHFTNPRGRGLRHTCRYLITHFLDAPACCFHPDLSHPGPTFSTLALRCLCLLGSGMFLSS